MTIVATVIVGLVSFASGFLNAQATLNKADLQNIKNETYELNKLKTSLSNQTYSITRINDSLIKAMDSLSHRSDSITKESKNKDVQIEKTRSNISQMLERQIKLDLETRKYKYSTDQLAIEKMKLQDSIKQSRVVYDELIKAKETMYNIICGQQMEAAHMKWITETHKTEDERVQKNYYVQLYKELRDSLNSTKK